MADKGKKGMVMVISVGGKPPKKPEDTSKPDVKKAKTCPKCGCDDCVSKTGCGTHVKKAPIPEVEPSRRGDKDLDRRDTGIGSPKMTPTMRTGRGPDLRSPRQKRQDEAFPTPRDTDEAIREAGIDEYDIHQNFDTEIREAAKHALNRLLDEQAERIGETDPRAAERFMRQYGFTDDHVNEMVDDILNTGGESMASNPHFHGLPEMFSHIYQPPKISRTSLSDPSQYGILRDFDKRVGTQMDKEREEALASGDPMHLQTLGSRGPTEADREPEMPSESARRGLMAPSTIARFKAGQPPINPFAIQTSFDTIAFDAAWDLLKRDKEDMRVGKVYPSDRAGKKIMMRTHEDKKIHAGAKGYGNYKGKGKNRGGGTHTDEGRRDNFKARHNCDQCKGKITTPKCLACEKLW